MKFACNLHPLFFFEGKTECTVADVLVFFSGSNCEPPLGFTRQPKMSFLYVDAKFCTASTCDIELCLPTIHNEYEAFKEALELSFMGNDGFGGGV